MNKKRKKPEKLNEREDGKMKEQAPEKEKKKREDVRRSNNEKTRNTTSQHNKMKEKYLAYRNEKKGTVQGNGVSLRGKVHSQNSAEVSDGQFGSKGRGKNVNRGGVGQKRKGEEILIRGKRVQNTVGRNKIESAAERMRIWGRGKKDVKKGGMRKWKEGKEGRG